MSTATEIKLLTLLNVSAVKRPRELDLPGGHRGSPSLLRASSSGVDSDSAAGAGAAEGSALKKRRKSVVFGGEVGPSGSTYGKKGKGKAKKNAVVNGNGDEKDLAVDGAGNGDADAHDEAVFEEGDSDDEEGEPSTSANSDLFNVHFGATPPILTPEALAAAEENQWKSERKTLKGFGRVVELQAGNGGSGSSAGSSSSGELKTRITPSLASSLKASSSSPLVSTSLAHLGTYKDFFFHSLDGEADGSERQLLGEQKEAMRKAAVVHALNHVLKTRRKIIRNNERLAHAASGDAPSSVHEPPRDQSFTRPKVLLLLPLRSLALHYLKTHLFPLAPAGTQIENQRPFTTSFSLPEDEEDPLASTSSSTEFPVDHLVNFRGNSDDNFRIGIKITRKAWRVVMMPANEEKLLDCDILISSPLGFKMAAEREDSTDLLSSIEVALVDGVDVMQMQNWEHVQFIFNNMNKIPKSPHGCDFSRVKPWYLESQAQYVRQTVILSRYDTPEARALFNRHCHNLQGKIRTDAVNHEGVLNRVRSGVRQVFERVDLDGPRGLNGEAAVGEVDARLEWFTKKTIPALLRSAISRQNTLIVVPSYFDFVRVVNHLRKTDQVTFAAISEYSSNSEIGRARTLFFKGKKSFLIVTERFHFYRRYKIRGAKTIVFYSLPDHAQFYSEFMATPFMGSKGNQGEVEVDEAEVSGRTLFSRFDALKVERVVGTANARRLLTSGEGRFEFL
ncbi:U3 small nucleolar RNA-associated protein 25 [Kwoniella heveanensis BCC8398]|uniref:U3 small nucleolar RNA-associated protein 25 n=1 Tax=Kwoniella heveanensis BCC8398 TaxID=1296120 RepID=A0A1B9GKL9_9TREE|nr:U3 small nucleolar RNA-associated protein 25 [Kwoniella heveanensis BCC8398]